MNELQNDVDKFINEFNLFSELEYRFLDMVSELGEVSKELLKMTDYGKNEISGSSELFEEELGDLLFSMITVANYFDIDLQEQLENAMKKYRDRFEQQGDIGSGN